MVDFNTQARELTDGEIALAFKALIDEAELRYPDAQELQDAHAALNIAARTVLSASDAAAVGVYPLKTGGTQPHEVSPPPGGKGDPPPGG